MSQNMVATVFQTECFTSVIKGCFDAWRQYKQDQLFKKTYSNLHSDELERISHLNQGNQELLQARHKVNTTRACEAIKVKLQKQLWSFLNHWRTINVHHHESVNTTLRDKAIKLFFSTERVAFNRWKRLHSKDKRTEREGANTGLQTEQLAL